MSFLSGIGDLLKQYSGQGATPANAAEHFDQVAQAVPQSTLAGGLAKALNSGQGGGFASMATQLFSNSNGVAQAGMLSALAASLGPEMISKFAAGNPNSPLTGLLQQGATAITPQTAASVNPADVQALAQHAQTANPGIIDRISQIYAEHPTAIKALGAGALAIAMKHISETHQA